MLTLVIGIPLITLLVSTASTISVLPSSRQENARLTLKVLMVLISMWSFASLMYHSTSNPSTLFWLKSILVLAALTGAVGVHFCVAFTRNTGTIAKSIVVGFYSITALVVIIITLGYMTKSAVLLSGGAVNAEFSNLAPFMWGIVAMTTIIGLAILIISFIKARSVRDRFAALPILGFVMLTLGGLSNIFVGQYPVDILANFIFICLLTYSVVGSHILRQVIPEKWWVSSTGIGLMFVVDYIGIFTFSSQWSELSVGMSHVSASIIVLLLALTTARPLRTFLYGNIVEYIFPFSHRYYESLRQLSNVDHSLRNWEASVNTMLRIIKTTTRTQAALLLTRNDETHYFEIAYASDDHVSGLSYLKIHTNDPFIKELLDRQGLVAVKDIEMNIHSPFIIDLEKNWSGLSNTLFCGLLGFDGLVGIIALIVELPSESVRTEEKDFLALASRQIAPIIENTFLYQTSQRELVERKRVQESLIESEERYRALVENAEDFIFMVGRDLGIISMNKSAVKFLGVTGKTYTGKTIFDVFPPESAERYSVSLKEALATGMPVSRTSSSAFRGREITLDTVLSPIRNAQNEVIAVIGVSRDVSERKRAEERERSLTQQLNLANRLATIGEMAAGIAHEINNPLTAVIGFSDLLAENRDLPGDVRQSIEIVNRGAQRVSEIVKNLLVFSRQQKLEKNPTDINNILTTTLQFRAYSLRENKIEVETDLDRSLPSIMADAGQLQQVFLNIIMNAEWAILNARRNGHLRIKTERLDGMIRVSFADDGVGISEADLPKLFHPFFTTKEVGQGTGLGLSICHGIVSEHGGKIYAKSKLGEGTTFFVELPVKTAEVK